MTQLLSKINRKDPGSGMGMPVQNWIRLGETVSQSLNPAGRDN